MQDGVHNRLARHGISGLVVVLFLGLASACVLAVEPVDRCNVAAPGADLSDCDLSGRALAGLDLANRVLRNVKLENADLSD